MNGRKYDAVALSDSCCDIIFGGLERIPEPGGEEYCETFSITSGGGANTPMGLARLGRRVGYVSAVGDDSFGDVITRRLDEFGVSGEFLQRPRSSSTWVSAVLSTRTDRAFASYAGARVRFNKEIAKSVLIQTRHLHSYISYGLLLPHLADWCLEYGVTLSLDSSHEPGRKLSDIEPLLKKTAVFTPNSDEACALTRADTPEQALRILGSVCECVVITLGKDGCIAAKSGGMWRASAASTDKIVDLNGAGDMFTAGLLCGMLENMPFEEQLKMASASGSLAVTYAGGVSRKFDRSAVESLMKSVTVEKN